MAKIHQDERTKKLLTHPDAIMRGCFGAGLPDPDCSSSTHCCFEPSLSLEGSNKSEWPPPADFGGTTEGSDGAEQPVSAGSEVAVEGLDKARRPNFASSEAAVEGLDGAGHFNSTDSGGTSSPSCPVACRRKDPTYGEGGSLSLATRSSHRMGDMEP